MGFITQNGLFWICLILTYPNYTICMSWHLAIQTTLEISTDFSKNFEIFDDRSDLKFIIRYDPQSFRFIQTHS